MSPAPAKDNKNVIVGSVFGLVLLVFVYFLYNAFFAGSGPAPTPAATTTSAPVAQVRSSSASSSQSSDSGGASTSLGVAPGVAAKKMASTSSSLDPTLDETAMLRTESLVYTGSGRNIFSLMYVPPPPPVSNLPKARPGPPVPVGPPPPQPPPPTCPPTCPPINLKFFGVATRANGDKQAFLLSGEDVYMAKQNDIVARKYKIVGIGNGSIQVEDLVNKNTQTLPLQQN